MHRIELIVNLREKRIDIGGVEPPEAFKLGVLFSSAGESVLAGFRVKISRTGGSGGRGDRIYIQKEGKSYIEKVVQAVLDEISVAKEVAVFEAGKRLEEIKRSRQHTKEAT